MNMHNDQSPTATATAVADAAAPAATPLIRIYLVRGVLAVAWAAVFAAASDSLTTGVGVLLVAYPLIDVLASLADVRDRRPGAERTVLLANAAVSALAAAGLAVAATGTVPDVLRAFGAWAVLAGAAQLAVAVRRRGPATGGQWPMLVAGTLSFLVGIFYIATASGDDPQLDPLATYAAAGGVFFVAQAAILARRARTRA
jgi:hypothetical protein